MPATLSYPGVYVQEIPSGVRTITGVPTAIAAFIGRAARGPVNVATTITSYADYERTFGGLAPYSNMSFAIRDFFTNGGGQAVVVRLFNVRAAAPNVTTAITVGALTFEAASPGTWGRNLRVTVDTNVLPTAGATLGVAQNSLFNLTVFDVSSGRTETFTNLTVADHSQRSDRVLAARS
jgi:phage tail sheath protein FI